MKNIKGRFTPGLKAVMQLQPLRCEYKPDNALGLRSSGEHIGFGAQVVQKIIPEAISKNNEGYLLVNNDPILWTMLNAIKEQQQEIRNLRGEVRSLQDRSRKSICTGVGETDRVIIKDTGIVQIKPGYSRLVTVIFSSAKERSVPSQMPHGV